MVQLPTVRFFGNRIDPQTTRRPAAKRAAEDDVMKPKWKPGHPIEDGLYWISVDPKHREPTHWEQPKTPSVWFVWVNDGFCQALTQGMKSYPLSAVPPCDAIMKHAEAEFRLPVDPWKERVHVGK